MPDTTLPSARVVLVCGVSCSGKTRLARRFEADGYTRLSSDALLWERAGEAYAAMSPEARRELFMSVNAALASCLAQMLDAGLRVVVDAPLCKRPQRDALRRICADRRIDAATIFLDVSLPELQRRLTGRRGTGPDDQIVSPDALASFYSGFERPAPEEHAIILVD